MILQGIVRGYYLDQNGNDVTKCFSAEGDFFCTEGFRADAPSSFFIESLEDCKCIKLPYFFIREAKALDNKIRIQISKMFEKEINNLEHRTRNILMLNAEERYIDFCSNYPQLYHRLPLKYISSYIAVRPETLSRIRKKMK